MPKTKTQAKPRTIELGALATPLKEQLAGTGIKAKDVSLFQRQDTAISLLKIGGLLTEREADAARKRLVKRIGKALDDANPREAR